jgi:hypothetical protein
LFCPKCGAQNDDNARFCAACGTTLNASAGPPPYSGSGRGTPDIHAIHAIPTYMAWSVLTTLFCCLPFGIVAIIKSSSVDKFKGMGDFNGAMQASNQARNWALAAGICGFVATILIMLSAIVANIPNH